MNTRVGIEPPSLTRLARARGPLHVRPVVDELELFDGGLSCLGEVRKRLQKDAEPFRPLEVLARGMEGREIHVADEREHYQAGSATTCWSIPPSRT